MCRKYQMWRKGVVEVHPNLWKTSYHNSFIKVLYVQVIVNFSHLKNYLSKKKISTFWNKKNIFKFEILILSHI